MIASQKNQRILVLGLFVVLAANMSWIHGRRFVAETFDLSSQADLLRCSPGPDSRSTTGTKTGRAQVNGKTKDLEWRYTITTGKCQSHDVGSFLTGDKDGEEGAIIDMEAFGCTTGDCRQKFFIKKSQFADIDNILNAKVKGSSKTILEQLAKDELNEKNIKKWTDQVNNCKAQWKNEDDHSEGVKGFSSAKERIDACIERMNDGDHGEKSAVAFFDKHIAGDLESMINGTTKERDLAMRILKNLKDKGEVDSDVTHVANAMYGYAHWNKEFDQALYLYDRGSISGYQLDALMAGKLAKIRNDFRREGLHAGEGRSEYQYWFNELQDRAEFIVDDPERALAEMDRLEYSRRHYSRSGTRDRNYSRLDDDVIRDRFGALRGSSSRGRTRDTIKLNRSKKLPKGVRTTSPRRSRS